MTPHNRSVGTISGNDRRKAERAERYDYGLKLSSGGRAIADVQIRDVSPDGVGVQVGGEIKAGQQLNFEFVIPGGTVSGVATVVWAEPFHMGYRGGAKFTSLGFFERRKLKRSLGGSSPGSLADTILLLVAVILIALVVQDVARHPYQVKAIKARLQGLSKPETGPAPENPK
ncbi:PilZ domain-containing protein [bacterium]|nr:MAG: PilZ domain-containing protein [bacterium]